MEACVNLLYMCNLFGNENNHSLIWGLYGLKFNIFVFPDSRACPKFELIGKYYFVTVHS